MRTHTLGSNDPRQTLHPNRNSGTTCPTLASFPIFILANDGIQDNENKIMLVNVKENAYLPDLTADMTPKRELL